jgi:phosphate transport system permease protein
MTTDLQARPLANSLTAGKLPRAAPWAVLAASLAVCLGTGAFLALSTDEEFNWILSLIAGVALFVLANWLISRLVEGARQATDRLVTSLVTAAFVLALIPLIWLTLTVVADGLPTLFNGTFLTHSMRNVVGEGGGALHAIIGSLEQVGLATLIGAPIGVLTAIYLVEYGRGALARAVSFMVDILTGVPSIVAALFIYAVWVTTFGFQRVGFAVALSLVLLMVPVVVRSTEEMLKLVPNELREASYALGVPKWKTIARIVIPTAFSGIVTGVLLGLARIMGETAPLLILGPYTKNIATNLFSGNMATLPTMINQDRVEALQPALDRVWGAALTLILLILLLNVVGRIIARFGAVRT